ncbi:ketopantoate reductase family protein [Saliphagus infecundisoli]|uniref:2-dehydropantoate 2-reductase n=1 Tax=Saliphagus infecundisoli TaxID=1849069 RepID=A0ABD5QDZ7_9EURY|nr:ketopantoate reductase family protein [Saliphagus infecundisoli]
MEIVVLGAGSLGSLVGGLLAGAHDVTLVGREPHVEAIEADGLEIRGEYDRRVFLRATAEGEGLAADCAVVTVKSFDTPDAAHVLATGEYGAVISLQNGMGNEAVLAGHHDTVLAGTATYGAVRREPGVVDCTGRGEVVLGAPGGGRSSMADRVGEAFRSAGLETTVAADMPRRLWAKLAVNAGINAVTALARVENGAVLEAPAEELVRAAARETARTARAHGVDLSNREAIAATERVADRTAGNESSMRQDVENGRQTEIDAINGYVVDRAEDASVAAPTNRLLAGVIRTWERGRKLR